MMISVVGLTGDPDGGEVGDPVDGPVGGEVGEPVDGPVGGSVGRKGRWAHCRSRN